MAKSNTFHVVPHDGAWAVRSTKKLDVFDRKEDAIDEARKRAHNKISRILVHGKSGQIIQNVSAPSDLTYKIVREAVRSTGKAGKILTSERASNGGRGKLNHIRKR